jgi:pimeloyl-ACP methyl ester carboxylesterase
MINFTKTGQGPTIVFIHGFCESLTMWEHWVLVLARTHTVYTLDLPGFGKSPLSNPSINLEMVAVILQEWMEIQEITDPILIGHSLGGYVTLALTELMGTDIQAIALLHSTALADSLEKKHTRDKTHQFIQKFGVEKFIESFVPPLFSEENRQRLQSVILQLINVGKQSSKTGVLAYIQAMRDRKDRMEIYQNYPNPKLMIAGVYDQAVTLDNSRQHQPFSTTYHELTGVGHMGMFEASDECLGIITDFLENLKKSQ